MPMAPAKITRNTKNSNGVSSSLSGGTSIHSAAKMTGVTARRAAIPAVGRAPQVQPRFNPRAARSAAQCHEAFSRRPDDQHVGWGVAAPGGRA